MFAITAEYLMGWAMACADGARKQRAEWPPHPDRAYMALAAAWFETGCEAGEGAALRWLESLQPPALSASGHEQRTAVTYYVPVNDAAQSSPKTVRAIVDSVALALDKAKDAGLAQLPELRGRQARGFPAAIPHDPVVHFVWQADLPAAHRDSLAALCLKVTSIGHSASLVRMWLTDAPRAATWVPGEGPTAMRLRVSGPGRLAYLEQRMNKQAVLAYAAMQTAAKEAKGRAKQQLQRELDEQFPAPPVSLRPEPGLWQPYVRAQSGPLEGVEVVRSGFDDRLIVLALSGQRLGLQTTLRLTEALRGALLSGCAAPLPEWLSGHALSGAATREPHVALLPLAFAGAAHADGRLLGVALALPRSVDANEAARVLGPWLHDADGQPRDIRLFDAGSLACTATLETRERPPVTLDPRAWVGPARRWATVTPIALDRHFGGADIWARAAEGVADACERIGLPRPADVLLHPNSLHEGVPPSRAFAPILRKRDGGRLAHTHAVLSFDRAVLGPVALGAGRFRGYGLCRPLRSWGTGNA
ncbi:MAG: type I-G CRISPR-associated protein Csb2 [Pseudomonadota bacterium]